MPDVTLSSLLARPRPILLDGAVGTELLRRGVRTELPLWSAHALLDEDGVAVLTRIHEDYARAGAEILVTNTFRTSRYTLERAGRGGQWRELNRRAVEAARAAAEVVAPQPCLVAGGLAPLEDCYRPELTPPEETCFEEHRRQAELLAELGVDLFFLETFGDGLEAKAALRAARGCGLDVVLSLCPKAPAHLLSGEPLEEIVPALIEEGGEMLRGLMLNCALPEVMDTAYPRLATSAGALPHGFYPHMGEADDEVGWKLPEEGRPAEYAAWMKDRATGGTRFVGGCCGTTPEHIAALREVIGTD